MRFPLFFCTAALLATVCQGSVASPASAADVELWRLDCGSIGVRDLSIFSDSFHYAGQSKTLTDSCYLIRHGDSYMLWDTGLPAELIGQTPDPAGLFAPSLDLSIADQLAEIAVRPEQIELIGISHYHFDHLGQASAFPQATLMIGAKDWEALNADPLPFGADAKQVQPWLDGGKVDPVAGDKDVFGDGSVTMLAMPGHTPGETALLVRLAETGPVLLSGDVVHFHEQLPIEGVPAFNTDRADSLASLDRLIDIAAELGATLIIQHDVDDVAKLPAFPESAK